MSTGTAAASALLEQVTARLHGSGIRFAFERNHDGYPQTLTGDVDLVVPRDAVGPCLDAMAAAGREAGWQVFCAARSSVIGYLGFVHPTCNGRAILVFECFAGVNWRGVEVLGAEALLDGVDAASPWPGIPVAAEVANTVLHYLLYKGAVPGKYHARLASTAAADEDAVARVLARALGSGLSQRITTAVARGAWDDVTACRPAVIRRAVLGTVLRPTRWLRTVRDVVVRVGQQRRGLVVAVTGDGDGVGTAIVDDVVAQLLEQADRLHIMVPPVRVHLRVRDAARAEATLRQARRVTNAGGLALVSMAGLSGDKAEDKEQDDLLAAADAEVRVAADGTCRVRDPVTGSLSVSRPEPEAWWQALLLLVGPDLRAQGEPTDTSRGGDA